MKLQRKGRNKQPVHQPNVLSYWEWPTFEYCLREKSEVDKFFHLLVLNKLNYLSCLSCTSESNKPVEVNIDDLGVVVDFTPGQNAVGVELPLEQVVAISFICRAPDTCLVPVTCSDILWTLRKICINAAEQGVYDPGVWDPPVVDRLLFCVWSTLTVVRQILMTHGFVVCNEIEMSPTFITVQSHVVILL